MPTLPLAHLTEFYVDGGWMEPLGATRLPVHNPSDESVVGEVALGSDDDVHRAVAAANTAVAAWGSTEPEERSALLARLAECYEARMDEMALAISTEMGSPIDMALLAQAGAGQFHLRGFVKTLGEMTFDRPLREDRPGDRIRLEPTGVAALITPWNWPMNQVTLKVGAALAAGCTMVLKPSELAPLSSLLFAELVDEAGFPPGVFNLVNGNGLGVGTALTSHPDVDVVSFTGSTRAGVAVTKAAAPTVKRVSLELGGKSPNLVFADCDVVEAVRRGAAHCFDNTGQSCNAPTRMLVERSVYDQAVDLAAEVAATTRCAPASEPGGHIGPLVSAAQFERVQALIKAGIEEGARLVEGGPGRPDGLTEGWFVRPTVFADVSPDMRIAREEIFGPVLAMAPFDSEEEALALANNTPYGLASYVQTGDAERARRVSAGLRAGMVQVNGAPRAPGSPFGGYKQSGVGREGGVWGVEEFLETKSVSGL
ncbi:MAG: aldehyde dehydrogenase family protein [Microthrixaceae bacterium]